MEKTGYSIKAHENGWAVMIGGVIQSIYPSEYLAEKAIKNRSHHRPVRRSKVSPHPERGPQPVVTVPNDVSLPLKDNADEVRLPVDISGRDLSTGKL